MDSAEKIINLEFGLSQLSGNKSLFLRLLQKFADEYQTATAKLQDLSDHEQWHDARIYIHTIKGVASNLGFIRLQQACKASESELKANQTGAPASLSALKTAMTETLNTIARLQTNPDLLNPSPYGVEEYNEAKSDTVHSSDISDPPATFIQALEQSEFIAQEQLDDWLAQTTSDSAKQNAIRDAIDELDYDTALTLLRD